MDKQFKDTAKASIAPRLARGFRFSWLTYGAAAYFGLKFLNKRGILPKQTDAALGLMDKGIDFAKNQIGLGSSAKTDSFNSSSARSSTSSSRQLNADEAQVRH